ncbi:multicomponent K+:H+ antiporter subunit E [Amaricoccus macauensis]|uniref:Multicomponent K+:H+ antiporter subunit E n=1 Tax=Amaricoccus macauensis TaxID=57001 RepID=A0A840SU36_9RHOB|nr:Na+/H+ antiporter subunit E [Amaricoccus macauensis]MBB5222672.1 multicomponent K+:H+ antiporter subunit E [Amaricoccus macauensis]
MSRILPHPLLSLGVVIMWLLLNRVSPGHLVLGAAVALVVGQAMAALEPSRPRIRRWDKVVVLCVRVVLDIIVSNVAVARIILGGGRAGRRAGFVEIDLDISDPTALAVLAVIVTATPGTAWIDYDAAHGRLLLHVFDLADPEEWRETVNQRYGRLLKEIFE